MAQLTAPIVFDHDDLQRMVNEKIAEVKAQFIPKAEYENRLKADMVAMLTELQLKIEELEQPTIDEDGYTLCQSECLEIIQQKINSLKENTDGNK